MKKQQYTFENFVVNAGKDHEIFYNRINKLLINNGYKSKIELKKSGYAVSYINCKTKKILLNYVSRKKGILVRIYADNANKYVQTFDSLPDSMVNEIKKGQDCKRMIDENACNSKCKKGISIILNGEEYGKCRYTALVFLIESDKYDTIEDIIEHEITFNEKE